VERVEIRCSPENHASAAIPPKLGYVLQESDGADLAFALAAADYPGSPSSTTPLSAYDAIGMPLIDDLA
jgi:hypothetical protein